MQSKKTASGLTRRQYWQPPEALTGYQPGTRSSAFAFGMLIYELLHRKEPFQDEDREVSSLCTLHAFQCLFTALASHCRCQYMHVF